MESSNRSPVRKTRSRLQLDRELELLATRLLSQSIKLLGRGDYPFYTDGGLVKMNQRDQDRCVEEEAAHPRVPLPDLTAIWKLGRRARLTSAEMDVVRVAVRDEWGAEVLERMGLTRARASRLLSRAIRKMQHEADTIREALDEQVASVLHQEQRRRAFNAEKHCPPGHEACRKTGLCTRRWYLTVDNF